MNENIKKYWATQELLDYGYKLAIKRNKKSAKVIVKFNDGDIYTQFKIEKAIDMYFIYDEWGDNITDTFDYTDSMDDCIKSCIYAFITRY